MTASCRWRWKRRALAQTIVGGAIVLLALLVAWSVPRAAARRADRRLHDKYGSARRNRPRAGASAAVRGSPPDPRTSAMEHALDSHELLRRRAAEARAEFTDAARTAALGVMRARPLAGLVRRQLWLSLSAAAALGVTAGLAAGFAGRRGRRRARWAKAVLLEQSGDGSRPRAADPAQSRDGEGRPGGVARGGRYPPLLCARTRHGGTHDWTWAPDRMGSRHARSKMDQGPIGSPRGCD